MRIHPACYRNTWFWLLGVGVVLTGGCVSSPIYCTRFTPRLTEVDQQTSRSYIAPQDYEKLLQQRTVRWEMDNILFSSTDRGLNKFKNLEESTMQARAILYDFALIQAELSKQADQKGATNKDSVYQLLLDSYRQVHRPEDFFRIQVHLQSSFARKSLEAGIWTIYLIDEEDDMYEPDTIVCTPIQEKKIERWEQNRKFYRRFYRTGINLYFARTTFYRQRIIHAGRKYIKLVMAYKQQIVGSGAWCFGGATGH